MMDLIKDEFKKLFTNEIAITIGAVLGVILGAVLLTLFVKVYAMDKDEAGLSQLDYLFGAVSEIVPITNYSVQQAHVICSIAIRKKMGSQLQTMNYDSRSSRYNQRKQMFKVFYDMTYVDDKNITKDSWAYCDVSSRTGKLDEIRVKSEGRGLFGF